MAALKSAGQGPDQIRSVEAEDIDMDIAISPCHQAMDIQTPGRFRLQKLWLWKGSPDAESQRIGSYTASNDAPFDKTVNMLPLPNELVPADDTFEYMMVGIITGQDPTKHKHKESGSRKASAAVVLPLDDFALPVVAKIESSSAGACHLFTCVHQSNGRRFVKRINSEKAAIFYFPEFWARPGGVVSAKVKERETLVKKNIEHYCSTDNSIPEEASGTEQSAGHQEHVQQQSRAGISEDFRLALPAFVDELLLKLKNEKSAEPVRPEIGVSASAEVSPQAISRAVDGDVSDCHLDRVKLRLAVTELKDLVVARKDFDDQVTNSVAGQCSALQNAAMMNDLRAKLSSVKNVDELRPLLQQICHLMAAVHALEVRAKIAQLEMETAAVVEDILAMI